MNPQYYQVGPGFAAFVVTFFLALSLWLLYRSFSKKLRRQRLEEQRRTVVLPPPPSGDAKESGVEDGDSGGDVVTREGGDS